MSRWLAEKASTFLAEHTSRRGFLVRSALFGTALATNPVELVARPVSAYAAVCECRNQPCACGTACCDGYTEFCCAITGSNTCPSGTILGGWWKADGSGFCGSAPRYYLDCNVLPGYDSVCYCHCSGNSCDNRVECCSMFRYGQCHQEYATLGAIYCRVVTCTPPWVLDPSCTTTSATDDATATHDAPCLHPPDAAPTGHLDSARLVPGGVAVTGWAFDNDTTGPIYVDIYAGSTFLGELYANQPRPDVQAAYRTVNSLHGFSGTVPSQGLFGPVQICANAINVGASPVNPSIGCIPLVLGEPVGNLDSVSLAPGGVRVTGWALDPDTASAITVHVYGNGSFLGATLASSSRPDVAALYPGFGPNHGFDAVIPTDGLGGDVTICAYAINVGPQNMNPQLGCGSVHVSAPFGNLDSVTPVTGGVQVTGWAIDPGAAGPIEIDVYVSGAFAGYGYTGLSRPDVASAYPAYGSSNGFSFFVPMTGTQSVCAYAIDADGTINPRVGCLVATT